MLPLSVTTVTTCIDSLPLSEQSPADRHERTQRPMYFAQDSVSASTLRYDFNDSKKVSLLKFIRVDINI